jgi:diacylglycerol kinase family enzyme
VRQSRPRRYRIRTANVDREFFSDFISAENVVTSGGGMVLTPHSDDNDGKFELLVMEHRNVVRKYLNLLALSRKKLTKQPNVYLESTDRVEITALDGEEICSLDGELRSITELDVEIGGKIRVISP